MSRNKVGGGIQSRNVTQKHEATREKPKVRAMSPGGVSQIGEAIGKGSINLVAAGPSFQPVKFGNQIAEETKTGPGGSREIFDCGTQGKHGK